MYKGLKRHAVAYVLAWNRGHDGYVFAEKVYVVAKERDRRRGGVLACIVSPEGCHVFSKECALEAILRAFLNQGRGTGYPFEGVVPRLAASDCVQGHINVAPFRKNWPTARDFR